jgi:hypothetical protein
MNVFSYTFSVPTDRDEWFVVHQLFKSNLTFCVVCVFNIQFEKSVFLRRVDHSQSTLQRQLRHQIKKKTPFTPNVAMLQKTLNTMK